MSDGQVLDASALLCLIRGEPGADKVRAYLPTSRVSAVNLSETVAKMADLGMSPDLIDRVLDPLNLQVVPFDAAQARVAGLMRPATRSKGLSFGDRACLALATRLGAQAVTTDRAWSALGGAPEVVLAR